MSTEVEQRAQFNIVRYAQVWEDADILLSALAIQPDDVCLSIASAGDNALAMLSQGPKKVIALDMNPVQLACLELRVAAYRDLTHSELLELIGSRDSTQRQHLYTRCRPLLSPSARVFWDSNSAQINYGIGSVGKFERYFELFRTKVLPLVHSRKRCLQLLAGGTREERIAFYNKHWNNWRWRLLFKIFFSRRVMGRMGRDPEFFKYVQGSVAEHILAHTQFALTELNPYDNPYLQWILTGTHLTALPCALREENFDQIRDNLDRLEWHNLSIEEYINRHPETRVSKCNLSDIFEYMSDANYHALLRQLVSISTPGARFAYWNMLVPRQRPDSMVAQLKSLPELAQSLHRLDKAFFYSAFVVEEVV